MKARSGPSRSIARRLVISILLVELIFAVGVIALAAAYEQHARFHAFDIMLRGRTDSLMGAVQEDPDDAADGLMLDRNGLVLPHEDVYEVLSGNDTVLGRSQNWQDSAAQLSRHPDGAIYRMSLHGRHYRMLARRGVRVVDPDESGGGKPRSFLVIYGAPTDHVWHEVENAVFFFAASSGALLLITGVLMAWLLHRGLEPLRQLAAEAEAISIQRWSFTPPVSALHTRELAPLASGLAAAIERLQVSFAQQRRFVSDAAHELKTAVAVLKSSLQLLHMRQRTLAEYQAGVEVTLEDCERMEEIVARMLTLARVENLEPGSLQQVSDLSSALTACKRQLQSMAELRRVTVSVATPADVAVPLSSEAASLLCSNLLMNALQHSPPDTVIHVNTTAHEGWAELRVDDEGEGIDAALLPHVFERFSRGDPSRSRHTGGTGLGLAICKAVVDKAGGTIRLESEPGRGTTVIVRLPVASAPVPATSQAPQLSAPIR